MLDTLALMTVMVNEMVKMSHNNSCQNLI